MMKPKSGRNFELATSRGQEVVLERMEAMELNNFPQARHQGLPQEQLMNDSYATRISGDKCNNGWNPHLRDPTLTPAVENRQFYVRSTNGLEGESGSLSKVFNRAANLPASLEREQCMEDRMASLRRDMMLSRGYQPDERRLEGTSHHDVVDDVSLQLSQLDAFQGGPRQTSMDAGFLTSGNNPYQRAVDDDLSSSYQDVPYGAYKDDLSSTYQELAYNNYSHYMNVAPRCDNLVKSSYVGDRQRLESSEDEEDDGWEDNPRLRARFGGGAVDSLGHSRRSNQSDASERPNQQGEDKGRPQRTLRPSLDQRTPQQRRPLDRPNLPLSCRRSLGASGRPPMTTDLKESQRLKTLEGFNSSELRKLGKLGSTHSSSSRRHHRSSAAAATELSTAVGQQRTKLLPRHQTMASSDSGYSKSDISSIQSDPPRQFHLHSSRGYDTTSLSSIETSSSLDVWNIRAMPNVSITRINARPISLKANPAMKAKPSLFDSLTDELLVHILSFLGTRDLMTAARVSRKFYFLAWEPQLWKTLSFSGENLDVDRAISCTLQIIARNGVDVSNTVKVANLGGCQRLTDRGLAIIARRCKSLQQLHLASCPEITNGGLLDLTSRCGQLEHLDVSGCGLVSGVGVVSSLSSPTSPHLNLQYLDMSDCCRLDDTSLRLVVESCPHLQYLYLRRCSHISDIGLKAIASYCLLLREFSVSDCNMITDSGLCELGRLGPSLRYLSLAKCDKITDAGVKTLARHCYRLRYLNLRGCREVTDSTVEWLARSCTRLRSLDIGKCDVTDQGLKLLAENCPNLKKLSVKACNKVSDDGVAIISYYCRGLQQLNIQDVIGVTATGYRIVRTNCRKCIIEHTNPAFSL